MKGDLLHSIFKYLNDKLSNKERHTLEKEVNADPFLQDAMDGFDLLTTDELESDISILNSKLNNRAKPKTVKLFQFYKNAAAITILIAIGSITLYLTTTNIFNNQLAEETKIEAPKNIVISPIQSEKEIDDLINESDKSDKTISVVQVDPKSAPIAKKESNEEDVLLTNEEEIVQDNMMDISAEYEIELAEFSDEPKHEEASKDISTSEQAYKIESEPALAQSKPRMAKSKKAAAPINLHTLNGTIYNENGQAVPGANIIATQSGEGVVSDFDGNFSININQQETIQIAYLGYKTEMVTIDTIQNTFELKLQPDLLALEEVIVIGYATQKRSITSGAISRVESSDISGIPSGNNTPAVYKARAIKLKYEPEYDEQARPIIGLKDYKKYLKKNFELTSNLPTKVIAEIEISSNGTIDIIDIIEAPNENFKTKAYQLIENGSQWSPALLNGSTISQKVTLTIKF